MGRYKVKKFGKAKNFIIYRLAAERLAWLQKQSPELSESYIINESIMNFKLEEINTKKQKIKELVKEHARLGNEIIEKQAELAEFIAAKENEPKEELKNAFEAKRK